MCKNPFPHSTEKTMSSSPFIHPTSLVDENASVGSGTKIWHFSHIMAGARIGKNCVIGQGAFIGPGVIIGDSCKIQNNVSLFSGVELESGVFCGPSVVFTNVINPRATIERKNEFLRTLVKQGASLGANSTIVCGTTIGRYAFIGAGSVSTKDILDHQLVYGNPARPRGFVCICGEPATFEKKDVFECCRCGSRLRHADGLTSVI